jgi:hypothetical protein
VATTSPGHKAHLKVFLAKVCLFALNALPPKRKHSQANNKYASMRSLNEGAVFQGFGIRKRAAQDFK